MPKKNAITDIATQRLEYAKQAVRESLHSKLDPLEELERIKQIQAELMALEPEEIDNVRFDPELPAGPDNSPLIQTGRMVPTFIPAGRLKALKLASENARYIVGKILPTPQSIDLNEGESLTSLLEKMTEEERVFYGMAIGLVNKPIEVHQVPDEHDDVDPLS